MSLLDERGSLLLWRGARLLECVLPSLLASI